MRVYYKFRKDPREMNTEYPESIQYPVFSVVLSGFRYKILCDLEPRRKLKEEWGQKREATHRGSDVTGQRPRAVWSGEGSSGGDGKCPVVLLTP